jgi:hypothetical protein
MAIRDGPMEPVSVSEDEEPEETIVHDEPEEDGEGTGDGEAPSESGELMARAVEEVVESRLESIEEEIQELEDELEELDNYTRISLNERRLKQNEAQLSELSASLTDFAERAFKKTNSLESKLEVHTMVLASLVESLDDEGIDVDLTDVQRYREDRLVTDASADQRLEEVLDRASE